LKAAVAADRNAIVSAQKMRQATLSQLQATHRAHVAALSAAKRLLASDRNAAHRVGATVPSPQEMSTLLNQVTELTQAIAADQAAIIAQRGDFTGINAARQKLASDLRTLRNVR
jgi:hypothetical protein